MANGSLFDDLDRLPEILVPDENLLQTLANCYEFLRQNRALLEPARFSQVKFHEHHYKLRMVFNSILLNQEQDRCLTVHAIAALRKELLSENKHEAIMRVAALLKAVSLCVVRIYVQLPCEVPASLQLGGATVRIAERPEGAPQPQVDQLYLYHPELDIAIVNE